MMDIVKMGADTSFRDLTSSVLVLKKLMTVSILIIREVVPVLSLVWVTPQNVKHQSY